MKEKRIEHLAAVKHSFEESRWVLDTMKIKAIGFLLDENLTILWASNPFYEKAGYTKEEFHSQYQNLRQYYITFIIKPLFKSKILQALKLFTDPKGEGDTERSGPEAFKAAEAGYYSAILMDIQMPVMNGYEATAAIRSLKREDAQTIPIIALTANAFITDVAKARRAGMNDHLAKPIETAKMLEVLGKWIG